MDIDEKLRFASQKIGNKKCSRCGVFKPIATDFYKKPSRIGQVYPQCKTCHNLSTYENRKAKK